MPTYSQLSSHQVRSPIDTEGFTSDVEVKPGYVQVSAVKANITYVDLFLLYSAGSTLIASYGTPGTNGYTLKPETHK